MLNVIDHNMNIQQADQLSPHPSAMDAGRGLCGKRRADAGRAARNSPPRVTNSRPMRHGARPKASSSAPRMASACSTAPMTAVSKPAPRSDIDDRYWIDGFPGSARRDTGASGTRFRGGGTVADPGKILASAPAGDWQTLDPADTLYMDVAGGRVVIFLASGFAPKTMANIKHSSARNTSTTAPSSGRRTITSCNGRSRMKPRRKPRQN